ncbi:MAG: tetratricopeptide repeat protein [Bacteroidota bacterium]
MTKSLLCLMLLIACTIIQLDAQDNGASSTYKADSTKIYQLGQKAFSLRNSAPDSALLLANEALVLAETVQDSQAQVSLWRIKGVVEYGQRRMDNAMSHFKKSYAIAQKTKVGEGRLLINIGNVLYSTENYDEALEKYESARAMSEEKDTLVWMDALTNIGSINNRLGNFQKSIDYYQESLVLQQAIGNEKAQFAILSNIGLAYSQLDDLDGALQTYLDAIERAKAMELPNWIAHFKSKIGYLYYSKGYYSQSIAAYQEAMVIRDSMENTRMVAQLLFRIGRIHMQSEDEALALDYFNRSLETYQQIDDIKGPALVLYLMGQTRIANQEYDEAKTNLYASIQAYKKAKLSKSVLDPYSLLGSLYEQTNQLDSARYYLNSAIQLAKEVNETDAIAKSLTSLGKVALKQNQIQQATNYFAEAMRTAQKEGLKKEESEALWQLYLVNKAQNRLREALINLEGYQVLNDTLFNEENTRKVAQLEAEFNFEQEKNQLALQNEAEKRALDEKIRQQRIRQWILAVFLLLTILAAFLIFRFTQFRRKAALEQERLNNQINLQKLNFEQEERQRLEELDAFKSRFFTNISHELRTPLTLILSPIQRLLKQKKWSKPEKAQLELIEDNANQLLVRVNEILDLTKLDTQQVALHETPTVLHDFSTQLAANFEAYAFQKSQVFNFDFQLDRGLKINLDQKKFTHIFNNYLANAIKYTPEKGKIDVLLYEKENQTGTIVLEVKDNGVGIPEKDLPHVFERFYRADQAENKAGGSGIGLALAREVATAMEGSVYATSKSKVGSSFFFEFPYQAVNGQLAETSEVEVKRLANLEPALISPTPNAKDRPKILVVEDNPQLRNYLTLLLDDQYEVISAKNGLDALEKLPNSNCELIISDIMMPQMDGFELLEALKSHHDYRHLPVVMLTARDQMADKLKTLRIGVDDYLTKPFIEEELLVRVQNLLNNYNNRSIEPESETGINIPVLGKVSALDLEWLEKLESLLKQEIANPNFNLDQAENLLFVSRSQLQRRVKKITGLTPNQYFREIKLHVAKAHLESKQFKTVNEVATAVGFGTAKYFSKIYEERFGKRPVDYLKSNS